MAIVFSTQDPYQTHSGNPPPLLKFSPEVLTIIAQQVGGLDSSIHYNLNEKTEAVKNLVKIERVCVLTNSIIRRDPKIQQAIKSAREAKEAGDLTCQVISVCLAVGIVLTGVCLV